MLEEKGSLAERRLDPVGFVCKQFRPCGVVVGEGDGCIVGFPFADSDLSSSSSLIGPRPMAWPWSPSRSAPTPTGASQSMSTRLRASWAAWCSEIGVSAIIYELHDGLVAHMDIEKQTTVNTLINLTQADLQPYAVKLRLLHSLKLSLWWRRLISFCPDKVNG
jgi:hypothetical protein